MKCGVGLLRIDEWCVCVCLYVCVCVFVCILAANIQVFARPSTTYSNNVFTHCLWLHSIARHSAGYELHEAMAARVRPVLHIVFQIAGEHIRGTGVANLPGNAMKCGE